MTIEVLHRNFKIFLDKADSLAYPELLDGEIDVYLNEAQHKLVKLRYGLNNIYQKGFEETQKRTDDLKNLVKSKFTKTSQSTLYEVLGNVYLCNINELYDDNALTILSSNKYQHYLKSLIITSGTCNRSVSPKMVKQDDLLTIIDDPFNRPSSKKPISFIEDGNIYVWLEDGQDLDNYMLTFLKRPVDVNKGTYGQDKVECELSEHMHEELVQMAVQIALENIESPRVQTQTMNVQTNE